MSMRVGDDMPMSMLIFFCVCVSPLLLVVLEMHAGPYFLLADDDDYDDDDGRTEVMLELCWLRLLVMSWLCRDVWCRPYLE